MHLVEWINGDVDAWNSGQSWNETQVSYVSILRQR